MTPKDGGGVSAQEPPGPFDTIERLATALARGETTSRALVELYLGRIERFDGKLKAYADVFAGAAREAAEGADAARARGEARGPLHGVPIAIKEIFDCGGHPTRAGSNALTDRHPDHSANAVRRLEAAGMIVLGRTRMVEFAYGGWGTNPVQGTPWNPWDLEAQRVPGGSSSGSAVAVAAGLAPAALGTDTGGSVRTPACWCGLVGLKTSLGLIGRSGVVPLCPTHDTVGPLARSVRDAALLLEALSGPDPLDPATADAPRLSPLEGIEQDIRGLRLGVLADADLVRVEPEIRRLFDAALADLESLGVRLDEVRLPLSIDDYLQSGGDIMSVESYAHLGRYVEPADSGVDPAVRARVLRGREIPASRYQALLDQRRQAGAAFLARLEGLHGLVVPGCHRSPALLDRVDEAEPPNIFGRFVNFLDLASLGLPIGHTPAGHPAGLQIVVRRFDDPLALRIGRAFERLRGGLVEVPVGV